MSGNTPPWPSLYNPGLEILHIDHRNATQAGGAYLYHAKGASSILTFCVSLAYDDSDIFRFTLFWTLLFYTPIFLVCGSYAFWNLNFPPSPRSHPHVSDTTRNASYPLSPIASDTLLPPLKRKEKERRSRLAFALLVLLTFLILSVAGAVVGSAVLGFTVTGLYKAAKFNMST